MAPLSQRVRIALVGTIGAAGAYFVFGGGFGGQKEGDPLDAVPRDSFLVATVNLAELRRSPMNEVIFGGRGGGTPVVDAKALGIGKLASDCGFDPLGRVEKLAVAVPEEGDKGELGVAAKITVTREELSKCTSSMAGQHGAKVETTDIGSFTVVEPSGSTDIARARLAYGHGGLLVVGRGAWFEAMLAAADGKKPDARTAPAHAAIRASLTKPDGWAAPTVLITALLPRSLRDRIRKEMDAEPGAPSVMAGVLGVSGVGLALRIGASGGTIDGAIELSCDTDDACAGVEKLAQKKRLDWSKDLMIRMVGFGPLLDSIAIKREGPRLRVTAGAPADTLAGTLDRVLRMRGAARMTPDEPPAPVQPPAPASGLRETIPAPRPSH